MDKNVFLAKFAEQFEDTDSNEIRFETKFHELEEWGSIIGMLLIAMARTEYNKIISGAELKECETVEDVYQLINSK